jgi:hypothetical protein
MLVGSIAHGVAIVVMMHRKHRAFVLNDHLKYEPLPRT